MAFLDRYVFPGGDLASVEHTIAAMERARFEIGQIGGTKGLSRRFTERPNPDVRRVFALSVTSWTVPHSRRAVMRQCVAALGREG
jgi:hypothetical protein